MSITPTHRVMIKNSLLRPGVFVQLQVIDFISVSITSAVCKHLLIQVHAYSVKKVTGEVSNTFQKNNDQCLLLEFSMFLWRSGYCDQLRKENKESFKNILTR